MLPLPPRGWSGRWDWSLAAWCRLPPRHLAEQRQARAGQTLAEVLDKTTITVRSKNLGIRLSMLQITDTICDFMQCHKTVFSFPWLTSQTKGAQKLLHPGPFPLRNFKIFMEVELTGKQDPFISRRSIFLKSSQNSSSCRLGVRDPKICSIISVTC